MYCHIFIFRLKCDFLKEDKRTFLWFTVYIISACHPFYAILISMIFHIVVLLFDLINVAYIVCLEK